MARTKLQIDGARLSRELDQLAKFSDAEPPAVTRVLFTASDRQARVFLKGLFADAGLTIREDPVGNIFARWVGTQLDLPAVGTGSHTDAIPGAGRYDGTVGVLGALEAIRGLKTSGWFPQRSIEILLFTSEEPTRFGVGCLGSRLLSGSLSPAAAASLKDSAGLTLEEIRRQAGCNGSLAEVRLRPNYYAAFVELHIEQGPILERENIPIGTVTAIAAPAALRIYLEGEGGHAGAVLMAQRKDALCAAAEIILGVETAGKSSSSPDTVATTGVCLVNQGAINSIPSRVTLEIDVRDIQLESRDAAVAQICRVVEQTCGRRGIRSTLEMLNADPPARAGKEVVSAIESSCRHLGLSVQRMVSRAYHDSLFMARLCPTGMIFIPCKNGVSHRPDEYSSPDSIKKGVEVLALTLMQLSEKIEGDTIQGGYEPA
jgi:ureidoglycolate amidohydrolase